MRLRPFAVLSLVLAGLAASLVPALPAAAADTDIVINEVESNGGSPDDWVELRNIGATSVDISGWVLRDSTTDQSYTVPAATSIAPDGYVVIDVNGAYFGLGGNDSARLFAPDGTTLIDSQTWSAHAPTTLARCDDGFRASAASSKGTANICEYAPADVIKINEIESDGGTPGDWVELINTAPRAVDVSGLVLKDSAEVTPYTIPASTSIAAGGYLVVDLGSPYYGLSGSDSSRLFGADGTTLIDSYTWTAHAAATTYGRCPSGTGVFATTTTSTKGAANDCSVVAPSTTVVINEVESNGGTPDDWVELFNAGSTATDVSGWILRDSTTADSYTVPAATSIPAGGYLVIDVSGAYFGLGAGDSARLFRPDGTTLVDSRSWTSHATTTYGLCGGAFVTTTSSTKGTVNDCSSPVRINEVESDGGTPGDWIELKNTGATVADISGWILRDSTTADSYTFPTATTLAAGAYLVVDAGGAVFGLGGSDSARLFNGSTLVDSYVWTSHAATTYGRCPDGTGAFATTTASTKGAVNACAGDLVTSPWPGGSAVTLADGAATFGTDLSGLVFDGDTLWAVSNGTGTLYKLVRNGGLWVPATGEWAQGKTLRYPDGGGMVDSEGVTVTNAGAAGGVFVASERNNAASGVSRLSVLRYDVSATGASLTASREWNLTSLLPAVGPNLGLEAVAWVPDTFLVSEGFVDSTTGSAYDPADYAGHGTGLFFVGVEGTGKVHALALDQSGTSATLIATITSGFPLVADLTFDVERGGLWVVCDDTCQGRTGFFDVDQAGAFAPTNNFERPSAMPNLNNEGFAVAPQSQCAAGVKEVVWSDDGDTGGNSLRSGTIACTVPATPIAFPEEGLIDANRGDVTAPATAAPGQRITVSVGDDHDGEDVEAWVYSTPTRLGTVRVSTAGTVTVTLPTTLSAGTHRIAITSATGTLIGWASITVTGSGLATTGSTIAVGGIAVAALLVGTGVVLVLIRRRQVAFSVRKSDRAAAL